MMCLLMDQKFVNCFELFITIGWKTFCQPSVTAEQDRQRVGTDSSKYLKGVKVENKYLGLDYRV